MQAFCYEGNNGSIKDYICRISEKKSSYSQKHSAQNNIYYSKYYKSKAKKHCNQCPSLRSDGSNREENTSMKKVKENCLCNSGSLIPTDTGFIMPRSGLGDLQELAKNIDKKHRNEFSNSALLYSPYRHLCTHNLSAADYVQLRTDVPLFIKNTALLI